MTITFITGANKGLGLQTARRLIDLGHTVILGARDPKHGHEVAERIGARFVRIDVTDDGSVAQAAADVRAHEAGLDVLINNAGVTHPRRAADELTAADALAVLDTNVVGIVRVTNEFLPLLRASQSVGGGRVVNVSSGLGSQARTHDPERIEEKSVAGPLYTASKAAVTMLTTQYAKALPDVRFNAADPGYTATDLNAHRGHQNLTEGTDAIVTLATEPAEAGTGRFIDRYGVVPW